MEKRPNFFVIGVAKGGTTSLHRYLGQHPEVYLTPIKETNHYALADINEAYLDPVYRRDIQINLDRYVKNGMKQQVHIAHVKEPRHYQALYSQVTSETAIGEISNSYIISPNAVQTIQREHPEARLIVMLRNPVLRAWSHYLMNIREGKTTQKDFITECLVDAESTHTGWGINHQYLSLGAYASQMQRVLEVFDQRQVKWMLYEDFAAKTSHSLAELSTFLGINPSFEFDLSQRSNQAGVPVNATVNKALIQSGVLHGLKSLASPKQREWAKQLLYRGGKSLPKMTSKELAFLEQHYRDDVRQLSDLLDFNFNAYWNIP